MKRKNRQIQQTKGDQSRTLEDTTRMTTKSKSNRKEKQKWFNSLGTRIIGGFAIVIFLMLILGIITCKKAERTMRASYEISAQENIESISMYANSICSMVTSKALETLTSEDVIDYYNVYYNAESSVAYEYYTNIGDLLSNMKTADIYINNYFLFGENGKSVTSLNNSLPDDIYTLMGDDYIGSSLSQNKMKKAVWTGWHQTIDEQMNYSDSKYSLVYTKYFNRGNGYLVIDLPNSVADTILSQLDAGEGSLAAIVTPDGREIRNSSLVTEFEDNILFNLSLVQETVKSQIEGTQKNYIEIDGQKYLLLLTPVGSIGIYLCNLIPESLIVGELQEIRIFTIIFTALAVVIAIVIAVAFANGISREVKRINNTLTKVSKGDFTTSYNTKRNDEFGLLAKGLNEMLDSMKGLLQNMSLFGERVINSSKLVTDGTEKMLDITKEINETMEEVAKGVSLQAIDTETGLEKMQHLSTSIQEVREHTSKMEEMANQAVKVVDTGKEMVSHLNKQTEATQLEMTELVANIEQVEQKSLSISNFADSIHGIAAQTNLLSLNASIEAARAGEHGLGFAVVAQEIRVLADQTMESSNMIHKVVEGIKSTTAVTQASAKQTQERMAQQVEVLSNTVQTFAKINEYVLQMVEGFRTSVIRLQGSEDEKEKAMEAVRNIATVSEESAASAENVSAATSQQLDAITSLAGEAEQLLKQAQELETSMGMFTI